MRGGYVATAPDAAAAVVALSLSGLRAASRRFRAVAYDLHPTEYPYRHWDAPHGERRARRITQQGRGRLEEPQRGEPRQGEPQRGGHQWGVPQRGRPPYGGPHRSEPQ